MPNIILDYYDLISPSDDIDIHSTENNLSINEQFDEQFDKCQALSLQLEAIPKSKLVLAQMVLFSLELLFTIIGLVLSVVFVCRKKTNFLLRLFVYLSVATTLLVALGLVTSIPETCEYFIGIYVFGLAYITWIATVLSFTAYSTLLRKLCAQTCSYCAKRQPCCVNRTPKQQVIMEVVLILVTIVLPIPFILGGILSQDLSTVTLAGGISELLLLFVASPAAMFIGLIGYVILLVWFCVRRRLIARRSVVLFVKELIMCFMYFLIVILEIIYFAFNSNGMTSRKDIRIGLIVVVTILTLYPYCVLVYILYSFRTKTSQHADNRIQEDDRDLVSAHSLEWFSLTTTDAAVDFHEQPHKRRTDLLCMRCQHY